jgi:anti-sigma regulatory factor (Ser/Thr protein kinase)
MNVHCGDYGATPRTPGMARSMVRFLLAGWQAAAETIAVAELLTSELVTNAVRHGCVRPQQGSYVPRINLALWHAPGLAVIEVSDQNEKPPEQQPADEESVSGRGLRLVECLSREWSYYYPCPGWKTVYCVIGAARKELAPPPS